MSDFPVRRSEWSICIQYSENTVAG